MVKQTEQQKQQKTLMKSIREFDKLWKKGLVSKRRTNFEDAYNHTMPDGNMCNHYAYNNRYSPNTYEERTQLFSIPITMTKDAIVLGSTSCFSLNDTINADNTELKKMIRDKALPDVGENRLVFHSSCLNRRVMTITLQIHSNLKIPQTNDYLYFNNSWWFWYLAELTKYEEKGRAFDVLMKYTNLCEDVIGVIGEYI
jgi:hypothetical protein